MADRLYKKPSSAVRTSRDGRSQRETPNRIIRRTSHGLVRVVKVAEKSDLREGFSKVVNVEGRSIALFRVKSEYVALANVCLHRGGPLGEGNLSGSVVTRPWEWGKLDLWKGSFTDIAAVTV